MSKIFDGLRPFQKAELLIMMFLAMAIPFHWLAAQYFEVALFVCAVLKLIFDQKFKLNEQQQKLRWAYIIFALTWLIYFIGMFWTQNTSVGWAQVSKKLGFLIFPVIFIISDMSYMDRNRLQAIGNALVLGCILFFLMNLVYAVYDVIFNGATTSRFFDENLMKLYYVHHSYLSMYAGLGMMFCFMEIFGEKSRKVKIINVLAYITLLVFIILIRSRAGLICMVLLFVLQWIWLTFIMKKKKLGAVMGCVFLAAVIATIVVFPSSVARITTTIKDLTTEHANDHRMVQYKGYKPVLKENWLFGVGTGDRTDVTQEAYQVYKQNIIEKIGPEVAAEIDMITACDYYEPTEEMRADMKQEALRYGRDPEVVNACLVDYLYVNFAIDKGINAHNMFFETLISVGVLGLLLLLAYFVIPLVLWIKTKRFDMLYFSFLLMIGFNMLFESVFEVQMGIIFFCFFNSLLFMMSFRAAEESRNDKVSEI